MALETLFAELVSGSRERQAVAHQRLVEASDAPENRSELAASAEPLLDHQDPQVRGSALILLALARGDAALPLLESRLSDPEPGPRCDLTQAAVELGDSGISLLRRLLKDPVEEVRFAAASGLAGLQIGEGLEVLHAALKIPALRFETFWALFELADPRSVEPLRRFLRRFFVNPFDRVGAAGVLARLGDRDAQNLLCQRIAARKGEDRGLAIDLAARLRLSEAFEPLAAALANPAELFRGGAARALGQLGDPRAIPLLNRYLDQADGDDEFRSDVRDGLQSLGGTA